MAKATHRKNAGKKVPPKKSSIKKKRAARKIETPAKSRSPRNTISTIFREKGPIRILIEIVVKHVYPPAAGQSTTKEPALAGGAGNRDFNYQFVPEQLTVLSLTIEDKTVQNPGANGTITLDEPPIGEVAISAAATGPGTGTLQVKYSEKDLFSAPEPFEKDGLKGIINVTKPLP